MYQSILLPVDLPHHATQDKAVRTAVGLGRTFSARLTLVTVVPDFGMSIVGTFFPEGFEQQALAKAREDLQSYAKDSIPDDVDVRHAVAHGTIYSEILRVAGEVAADLIVMASHRPEFRDYLLGPNAARVARHAACSVLVVRGD